jgi:hypothetical protein
VVANAAILAVVLDWYVVDVVEAAAGGGRSGIVLLHNVRFGSGGGGRMMTATIQLAFYLCIARIDVAVIVQRQVDNNIITRRLEWGWRNGGYGGGSSMIGTAAEQLQSSSPRFP